MRSWPVSVDIIGTCRKVKIAARASDDSEPTRHAKEPAIEGERLTDVHAEPVGRPHAGALTRDVDQPSEDPHVAAKHDVHIATDSLTLFSPPIVILPLPCAAIVAIGHLRCFLSSNKFGGSGKRNKWSSAVVALCLDAPGARPWCRHVFSLTFQANSLAFVIDRECGELLHYRYRDCSIGETATKLGPPLQYAHAKIK